MDNVKSQKNSTHSDLFFFFTENIGNQNAFDEEVAFYLNPNADALLIDNVEYELVHDRQKYLAANIPLENEDCIGIQEYLRLIWPSIKNKPFLNEDALLAVTYPELTIKMQLDKWWHPNVVIEEMPSEVDTFVEIARAIVDNNYGGLMDKLLAKTNTHWRNWPEGGSL